LKYERGNTDNIGELLYRVRTLISDDEQIQFICDNNLAYLDSKFDQIIRIYEKNLTTHRNDNQSLCIGEDAFCYIAHLYGRENDTDAERQWYIKAITYFEEHKFVCEHTQSCFIKMASFYQTKNDIPSCVSIYRKLVHHLLEYRSETYQLQRQIVSIVEYILQQLNADDKEQIFILKRLVQLVLKKSEDINLVDADFQWIIDQYRKNSKESWLVADAYESYLDYILQNFAHHLAPYIQTIIPTFQHVIIVYKLLNDPAGAFDVYQCLINIILRYSTDRGHIISTFKQTFSKW